MRVNRTSLLCPARLEDSGHGTRRVAQRMGHPRLLTHPAGTGALGPGPVAALVPHACRGRAFPPADRRARRRTRPRPRQQRRPLQAAAVRRVLAALPHRPPVAGAAHDARPMGRPVAGGRPRHRRHRGGRAWGQGRPLAHPLHPSVARGGLRSLRADRLRRRREARALCLQARGSRAWQGQGQRWGYGPSRAATPWGGVGAWAG